jgi:DcuC family C4-dicarboxylate transporter
MTLFAALLVIAAAVWAIVRRIDVRLVLLLAALALGGLAGRVDVIVQKFLTTLVSERFVLPIGCSLGFAYVLRQTACDQHLIHLLLRPIHRVRPLLIPGAVLVGALVNIPVISQLSTAVLVGTVLVPLLRATRFSSVTIGAGLLLGSSIGGELLNPGAPEVRTISEASTAMLTPNNWIAHVLPLFLIELTVAMGLFWLLSLRAESRDTKKTEAAVEDDPIASFRINPVKALVPFVPIALIFATGLPEPFRLFRVPRPWLVDVEHFHGSEAELQASFDCRLISAAMLVGVAAAALTDRHHIHRTALTFFEGIGFAFERIISLIVGASCFGEGVRQVGLATLLGGALEARPEMLAPAAVFLPFSFAMLCGSGMATTQSLFGFFVEPAHHLGYDPLQLGAMLSLASAAGRTLSPVAAVTLMCASLTGVNPLHLLRRLALPLLAGILAMLIASTLLR